jgi:hypothetical protein
MACLPSTLVQFVSTTAIRVMHLPSYQGTASAVPARLPSHSHPERNPLQWVEPRDLRFASNHSVFGKQKSAHGFSTNERRSSNVRLAEAPYARQSVAQRFSAG